MATSRNVQGRLLKWAISYDRRVARLKTWQAKLLYTWIIPSLDNLGRMEGEPRIVRSMTFPYEKITDAKVVHWLQDIHNNGLLFWYSVNGEKYLQCPTTSRNIFFREGEGRSRTSDYPIPPEKEYKEWLDRTRQDTAGRVGVDLDLDLDKDLDKEKDKYLDFVLLTKKEYQTLCDLFGESQAKSLIEKLNNYIGSKGKKYKSHYFTILNWAGKDGIRKQAIAKKPEYIKDFKEPDAQQQKEVATLVKNVTEKMGKKTKGV